MAKSAILELHFRVRSADLRKQDMTQVQYKFHQITHVDFYGEIVCKPRNRWVCKSSLVIMGTATPRDTLQTATNYNRHAPSSSDDGIYR